MAEKQGRESGDNTFQSKLGTHVWTTSRQSNNTVHRGHHDDGARSTLPEAWENGSGKLESAKDVGFVLTLEYVLAGRALSVKCFHVLLGQMKQGIPAVPDTKEFRAQAIQRSSPLTTSNE